MTLLPLAALTVATLAAALLFALRAPRLVARAPGSTLGVTAALCFAAAWALVGVEPVGLRVELDPSSTPLLPSADPRLADYQRAVLEFGSDEFYVVAMQAEDVFAHESLLALRRVSRQILALPGVRSAESLVDTSSLRYDAASDTLEVRRFVDDIPSSAPELAELRRRALADPLYTRTLVSSDARAAAINVRFRGTDGVEFVRADLDGRIRAILDGETTASRRFYVAGRPHVQAVAHGMMLRDLRALMPLALAVMSGVLWIVAGSLRGIAMPLGTVLVATLWTFGVMAWLGQTLNVVSIVLGPVLIAVGSVYGVHILAHYEEAATQSADGPAAALRLIERTRAPVLMSGLSTASGFGALLLTDVAATRQLGAFAMLGVAFVTLLSLTALPALVARLPLRSQIESGLAHRIGQRLDRGLEACAGFTTRHAGTVVVVWLVLVASAAAMITRIEVDTDYLSFFSERSLLRRDFDAVNRHLSGTVPLYVVFSGGGDGAFREPGNLSLIDSIQTRANDLAGVTRSLSMVDLLKTTRRALYEDDPAEERVPGSRREAAELLLLIPKGRLRPLANVDQSRANLVIRSGELGSAAVRALVSKLEGLLSDTHLPASVAAEITGETLLVNQSADAIARSQFRTVGVAALAVFAMVALTFRSIPLALVALVPNVVPVLLFYGLLGAGAAPLSLPTSLIGSIALGVAVDDTMHFLVRYRLSRRTGETPERAAIACARRVGRPIAITSAMLFLGFLVVGLSGFATLSQFGLLIGLTIGLCLCTDLVLLPALLVRVRA